MRLLHRQGMLPVLAFTLIACAGNISPLSARTTTPDFNTPTQTQIPTQPAIRNTQALNPTPTLSSTPQLPPLTQYKFQAALDYDRHHLSVDEQVTYFNNTGVSLDELLFLVEPNRTTGSFKLNSLNWGDGQPLQEYTLDGPQLRVPFPQPLEPEESMELAFSYTLNIPQVGAPFGYTERQTNLVDWYPYIPPYLPGEGWVVRQSAYVGEHLVYDMAGFQVELQLVNPTSSSGRTLTIAASAPGEKETRKERDDGEVYRYQVNAARNFTWSVSDQYLVLSTTVGDVTVTGYSFPYHAVADESALGATADALALFNQLFGSYPHKSLSVVEADFLNGMEADGMFFLSHAFYDYFTGTPQNNLIIIAAHEVAHQWFYGLVGNDQAREPWLDEALATYSERLFYEHVYPDLLGWWWDNRVYFHHPQGWVDSTVYEVPGFYPYRDAVYLRGALFLEDLRDQMGDEAFLAFLNDYLNRHRYHQASGDDFFTLLADYTQNDLRGVIGTYFTHR